MGNSNHHESKRKNDQPPSMRVRASYPEEGEPPRSAKVATPIQTAIDCDGCHEPILCTQSRHTCWICHNYENSFDLCEDCFAKQGHPHPMTHVKAKMKVVNSLYRGHNTAGTMRLALEFFSDRPCMGWREKTVKKLPSGERVIELSPTFNKWLTYQEVLDSTLQLGSFLLALLPPNSFVGICSVNRPEWFIADLACLLYDIISVPIATTLDDEALEGVVNNSQLCCVVCSRKQLPQFLALKGKCPSLRYIIRMPFMLGEDDIEEADKEKKKKKKKEKEREKEDDKDTEQQGIKVLDYEDVLKEVTVVTTTGDDHVDPMKVVSITYTSGSTGIPKGTVVTDDMWHRSMRGIYSALGGWPVTLSFAPLAHMTGRLNGLSVFSNGGRLGFYSGDMSLLVEDLAALRPTLLSAPPRFWNMLYEEYKKRVLNGEKALPSNLSEYAKKNAMKKVKKEALAMTKQSLGGKLTSVTTGSAPTSKEVIKFMRRCFNCSVGEGYGITEVGSVASNGMKKEEVDIKLRDVPEMGYTSADKPFPRGELLVKTHEMTTGYYRDADKTAEAFVDGYFVTGDIVEYDEITGRLTVIDRKKNLFKLAQGEFVAPERLETLYLECKYVDTIYIYGNTLESYVVAVVVPFEAPLAKFCAESGITITEEDTTKRLKAMCQIPVVRNAIMLDIARTGREKRVQPYEIPRAIYLEFEHFTPENGKLTPSHKLSRPNLQHAYGSILTELYRLCDQKSLHRTLDRHGQNEKNVKELVEDILREALHPKTLTEEQIMRNEEESLERKENENEREKETEREEKQISTEEILRNSVFMDDTDMDIPLAELAFDSLAIIRLANKLEDGFPASKISWNVILSRSSHLSLSALSQKLASLIEGKAQAEDEDSVDLDKELQLDQEILDNLKTVKEKGKKSKKKKKEEKIKEQEKEETRVLLTGATGFLGAFLLRDLIEAGKARKLGGGKKVIIYCLVRGCRDKQEAWDRIYHNMKHYLLWKDLPPSFQSQRKWTWVENEEKKEEKKRKRKNKEKKTENEKEREAKEEEEREEDMGVDVVVRPLLGDGSKYRLGLGERRWKKLAGRVDVIYNSATHVNGVFPYSALKGSNVTATMEILRLASQEKLKKVNHISTLSVLSAGSSSEEITLLEPNPSFHMHSGYSQSKFVADWLVSAAGQEGIPISIFRPGTISGDSKRGGSNLKDFVNKYIMGIIQLGYYPTEEGVVFDMAAVDWVSSSIVDISQSPDSIGQAYHLFNGEIPTAPTLAEIAESANSFPKRTWPELQPVSYRDWKRILEGAKENTLTPIRSYFEGSRFPRSRIFDCRNTLKMVNPPPPISQHILHRYIQFYIKNDCL